MYDELKERCRACSQGCIYPSECSYFDKHPLRCMRQLLSEAADAIEELTALSRRQEVELVELTGELASKPRWIPVTERLPEKNQIVVVVQHGKTWDYGQFRGLEYLGGDVRKWIWKNNTTKTVDYWMPKKSALPEPPKEGEA